MCAAAACADGAEHAPDRPARPGATVPPNDSDRAALAAESVATALDRWNTREVVKRLTEAGLVVSEAGRKARRPFLGIEGDVVRVGSSELELYVYEDAASRERDAAGLNVESDSVPGAPASLVARPRLVVVNNLVAVHITGNERLAERVRNALTARHTGR